MTPDRNDLLRQLGDDRILAHQTLFRHRHPDPTPPFHDEIINIWHANDPHALVMVFREGGKSTIAEEAFVIGAGFQLFHNALIIGSTEKRAVERLRAIKHEIEHNEIVHALFGELKDAHGIWNEAEVILLNGVRIIAVGRGQSLRGTKHLHYRPDFCFCDDIEEPEHVATPEARDETLSWFMSTVLPALDVAARIRVNATPLDREALPYKIQHQLKWPTRIYPIEYMDNGGNRAATWPARYSLDWIDKTKAQFEATGKIHEYQREYMCVAEDPTKKIFTSDMFKEEQHVLTWQPVYAFIDPARTVKSTSATTGWAVWSYAPQRRLHVWDGGGDFWKPDEIVRHVFDLEEKYRPVAIGIERDGLEEFLLQPLRQEALRRGVVLPLVPMKAPKGKLDFISGLQPHFKAGEIIFVKDLPELRAQFLSYPSGRIDGPNALAYAQLMRPEVVYPDFGFDHVHDQLAIRQRDPAWLCLNARHGFVTGVLVQLIKDRLHIIADWVEEGDTGHVASIIRQAAVMAGDRLTLVAPPDHFAAYSTLGLRGNVAKYPADLTRGSGVEVGRGEIRALLQKRSADMPCLQVGMSARWTINGFAAGFSYEIARDGTIKEEPRDGLYRCLMEGLESFTGMMRQGIVSDYGTPNVQFTASGQRYISALPGKAPVDAKDEYPRPDDVRTPVPAFLRR
jgi:hypothetical protein